MWSKYLAYFIFAAYYTSESSGYGDDWFPLARALHFYACDEACPGDYRLIRGE